ncbi:LysE family translocator [Desulforhopalus sp. 52FAK]
MINEYLVYITLAVTITALPGPAVILTVRNSIRYGYKVAILNIVGNFAAMVILASLSAAGLGAVILASSTLFSAIKIAGCLYLIYLGVKAWKAPYIQEPYGVISRSKQVKPLLSVFKEGFAVGIANPKAIAFFVALFPQFIAPDRAYLPQFLTLIFTIEGISITVLTTYAVCSSAASPFLSRKRSMTIFNKITGAAFMLFGLALLSEE